MHGSTRISGVFGIIITVLWLAASAGGALGTQYYVNADASGGYMNMRSGPGTSYDVVVQVPAGTRGLEVSKCRKGDGPSIHPWCQVEWNGNSGWISQCCISVAPSAPKGRFNLEPVDENFTVVRDQCEIETMPKVRDQGPLGICYAASAAVMLEEFDCYVKGNVRCKEVADNNRPSMLDIARFSVEFEDGDDKRDRYKYNSIKEGGSLYITLLSSWYASNFVTLACAPDTTQFLMGATPDTRDTTNYGTQNALWQKIAAFHESLNGTAITIDQAAMLKTEYGMKQDIDTIKSAFSEPEWSVVLASLLVPQHCVEDFVGLISPSAKMDLPRVFPGGPNPKSDYFSTIAKIREVVAEKKRPIGLSFCAGDLTTYKTTAECADAGFGHTVVIDGYRQVCDQTAKCVDSLKVMNSWGDSWQVANQDGWIDAKTILDATHYDTNSVFWLEKRPPMQY